MDTTLDLQQIALKGDNSIVRMSIKTASMNWYFMCYSSTLREQYQFFDVVFLGKRTVVKKIKMQVVNEFVHDLFVYGMTVIT